MQIWLVALTFFIDHQASFKAVKSIGRGCLMRIAGGQKMRVTQARCWRCLKAAVTPSPIKIQIFNWRLVNYWRPIHRHIHDAAPHAQQA